MEWRLVHYFRIVLTIIISAIFIHRWDNFHCWGCPGQRTNRFIFVHWNTFTFWEIQNGWEEFIFVGFWWSIGLFPFYSNFYFYILVFILSSIWICPFLNARLPFLFGRISKIFSSIFTKKSPAYLSLWSAIRNSNFGSNSHNSTA